MKFFPIFARGIAPLGLTFLMFGQHTQALGSTTLIDFDHDASGNVLNSPGLFNSFSAPSLSTQYAALGVTFSGSATGTGGTILNKSKGGFPASVRSGANFLAFQRGTYTGDAETITFTKPASNVSIYACAPGNAAFTMNAYSSAGTLISTSTQVLNIYTPTGGYNYPFPLVQLSVNSNILGTISYVTVTETSIFPDADNVNFSLDDLSFTTAETNATVSGTVQFDSIVPTAAAQPVTFEFRSTDGSTTVSSTQSVPASGAFSIPNLPRKAYTVRIKSPKYLAVRVNVDASGGDVSNVNAFVYGGDATDDNIVDVGDFGVLVNSYLGDASIPGSGYDARADFNGDGVVDVGDFGVLVNNYLKTGAN